jgi:hypothetical protein
LTTTNDVSSYLHIGILSLVIQFPQYSSLMLMIIRYGDISVCMLEYLRSNYRISSVNCITYLCMIARSINLTDRFRGSTNRRSMFYPLKYTVRYCFTCLPLTTNNIVFYYYIYLQRTKPSDFSFYLHLI